VAEHLNFSRAAEACSVSQPALSAQIDKLETILGVELFERDRRRVLLTAAGAALLEPARAVLAGVGDLVAGARALRAPLTGPLHLGVIPTIAPYLLPRALPRIRRRHPDLRLYIHEEPTERLVRMLESGTLDLLLLAREAELGAVELLDLFRDPFLLLVPRDHPLARRRKVHEEDLDGEQVILLEDGH